MRNRLSNFTALFVLALTATVLMQNCKKPPPEKFELKIPLGLDAEAQYIPENNPLTAEKVELGRKLYFDKRLSADNSVSCATCHSPKFGFTDGSPVSTGINGQKGGRSAPTVVNRLFSKEQFWDGRAEDLEAQALGPVENPIEMGNTLEACVKKLNAIEGYRKEFQKVFGTEVTADGIAKAIASFERTVISGNSPFDRFKAGEENALSESARRGLELFEGKANCVTCHVGFNFTDEGYRNIGVGMDKEAPDSGRFDVTKEETDRGAFKTPTLREIASTAPYMHDGSERTLLDVINFYDKGGITNPYLSTDIKPLKLTDEEKADLVAFMESLTGEMGEFEEPTLPE